MVPPQRSRRSDAVAQQHHRFRLQLFELANRTPATGAQLLLAFDEMLMFARAVKRFDQCFAVRQLLDALPRYARYFEQQYPGLFAKAGMLERENPATKVLVSIRHALELGEDAIIPDHSPNIPVALTADDSAEDQLSDLR